MEIKKINKFFIVVMGLFVSISAFYSYFSFKNIQAEDLVKIEGELVFSKEDTSGNDKGYEIKLEGYSANFIIRSVPLKALDRKGFNEKAINGSDLIISILKKDIANINKIDSKIKIYELGMDGNQYLKLNDVNVELTKNVETGFVIGTIALILTLYLVIFWR